MSRLRLDSFDRLRLPASIGLLALMLFCSGSYADVADNGQATALSWLSEMQRAVSGRVYKGEVAYLKNNEVGSFQLFHSTKAGLEQERLISLNTPLREVVRNSDQVSCYFPDSKSIFVENKSPKRSSLLDLPDDIGRVSKFYRLGLHGQEYVASRQSQVISIEPRDDFRYARLIWVDTESKLPIKFEMLDEDGQVAEQMVFTSLSIDPEISPNDLTSSLKRDSGDWTVREKEILPLDSLDWTLQDVPAGFQIVSFTRMKRPPGDRSVEHLLLSDGFASVSVYIEKLRGELKEHPRKFGAINARTVKIDGYAATVLGEVPEKTIEAIVKGLKHRPQSP